MIRFRSFRNGDPPAITEVWNQHGPFRGLIQPVSPLVLEERILSKPYFDHHGLIVAEEGEGNLVGFVHAGFGPTEDLMAVSTAAGVTCMLMVARHPLQEAIADDLLGRAEQYLRGHGAQVLYGGAIFPLNPFYLGLYGGSELPGVLASDQELAATFQRSGYREVDRCVILHLDLGRFRPVVDRRQVRNPPHVPGGGLVRSSVPDVVGGMFQFPRGVYAVRSGSDRRDIHVWDGQCLEPGTARSQLGSPCRGSGPGPCGPIAEEAGAGHAPVE